MKAASRSELARFVDHTLLRPDATRQEITRLCDEARENNFHGVCVNGSRVELAYSLLEDTEIKVTGMVGFPFGASDGDVKRYEAEVAIDNGAHEIEMVMNVGRLKDCDHAIILRELRDIAEAADERIVKVVLEMSLLTPEQIRLACELVQDSGVHFVCSGTVLGPAATSMNIQMLRKATDQKFGVKAAGGVDHADSAIAMLEAGATRLGTSNGVRLIQSWSAS
jgi:deoxyribose-phosphate aldolase